MGLWLWLGFIGVVVYLVVGRKDFRHSNWVDLIATSIIGIAFGGFTFFCSLIFFYKRVFK